MAQKINISEFSIKVNLNSAAAMKGMKRLEQRLQTLHHTINQTYKKEQARLKTLNAQTSAQSTQIHKQKRFNTQLKHSNRHARKLQVTFAGMRRTFAAFVAIKGLGSITEGIKNISQAGMKYEQASNTMFGALAGSSTGGALSKQNLLKLQKQQLHFAQRLAVSYGAPVAETVNQYAKFFAAASDNISVGVTQDMFKSLLQLGVVYGMSGDKMTRAMTAFTQMASKNQVMAEELKQQLGDVLPGSMQIFVRALNETGKHGIVTVAKLFKMMEQGEVIAADVFPALSREMKRMAEEGGLAKMLQSTAQRWMQLQSVAEVASVGMFRQFEEPLNRLMVKFNTMLSGHGFQTGVGRWIKAIIDEAESLLKPLFDEMKKIEEEWTGANTEGKHKILDGFGASIKKILGDMAVKLGILLGKMIETALNSLEASDLAAFAQTLAKVITAVWDNINLNPFKEGYVNTVAGNTIDATLGAADRSMSYVSDLFSGGLDWLSQPLDVSNIAPYSGKTSGTTINITSEVHANDTQVAEDVKASLLDVAQEIKPFVNGNGRGL